jgi:hypothetical protein
VKVAFGRVYLPLDREVVRLVAGRATLREVVATDVGLADVEVLSEAFDVEVDLGAGGLADVGALMLGVVIADVDLVVCTLGAAVIEVVVGVSVLTGPPDDASDMVLVCSIIVPGEFSAWNEPGGGKPPGKSPPAIVFEGCGSMAGSVGSKSSTSRLTRSITSKGAPSTRLAIRPTARWL